MHFETGYSIHVSHSPTEGATWYAHVIQGSTSSAGGDMPKMCVNNNPNTNDQYQDRTFIAWAWADSTGGPTVIAASYSNNGDNWTRSGPIDWDGARRWRQMAPSLATGPRPDPEDPDANVYLAWVLHQAEVNEEEEESDSTYVPEAIGSDAKGLAFASSVNGGLSWTAARITSAGGSGLSVRGVDRQLSDTWKFASSLPKEHHSPDITAVAVDWTTGYIYLVWTNRGDPSSANPQATDPNIYMIWSTDQGGTWEAPVKVNQDSEAYPTDQWAPWITWDPCTGALVVVFYDTRNHDYRSPSSDHTADTYVAVSFPGEGAYLGSTWHDFKVSDPAAAFSCYYNPGNEYNGVAATDGWAFPVWADDRDRTEPETEPLRVRTSPLLLWGVVQDSVRASYVEGTGNTIAATADWFTNLPASTADKLMLTSPSSTSYATDACSTCTTNGLSHTRTYSGLPYVSGVWHYTVESARAGCTGKRQSDDKTFVAWRVTQDSVRVSIAYAPGSLIDVTATWSTDYEASAGDQLMLRPPGETSYTYASPLCTNCTSDGLNHSLVFANLPCVTGYWHYKVLSSRVAGTDTRESAEKTFKIQNCIE
jgi:hypothetical protein